jgi:hypothetical protein
MPVPMTEKFGKSGGRIRAADALKKSRSIIAVESVRHGNASRCRHVAPALLLC